MTTTPMSGPVNFYFIPQADNGSFVNSKFHCNRTSLEPGVCNVTCSKNMGVGLHSLITSTWKQPTVEMILVFAAEWVALHMMKGRVQIFLKSAPTFHSVCKTVYIFLFVQWYELSLSSPKQVIVNSNSSMINF